MPFIQRLVQPVNLAQTGWSERVSTNKTNKLHCDSCKSQSSDCNYKVNTLHVYQHPHIKENEITIYGDRSCNGCDSVDFVSSSQKNVTETIDKNLELSNSNDATPFKNKIPANRHISTNIIEENVITPISLSLSPMKKLKQHEEFSSTGLSPVRCTSAKASCTSASKYSDPYTEKCTSRLPHSSPPTDRKKASFVEFDTISNITLSNTLRQLASLVLIASDMFDDLQKELQYVGKRVCEVQSKIITMERRINVFDAKTVTIPEGDLLLFTQSKIHYECNKSYDLQLFTANTRPLSVRILYDDAGSTLPDSTNCATSGSSKYEKIITTSNDEATADVMNNSLSCCSPCPDISNSKISTSIDTEIEIRLPAAIKDLRKWTSAEALGDVTVTPDCMHYVNNILNTSIVPNNTEDYWPHVVLQSLSSHDLDGDILPERINENVPLSHRLPSPEEQCKTIALKYPAEIVPVDTSGKGFRRMCSVRNRTFAYFENVPGKNNFQTDQTTVKRRSRSLRGKTKRRNTIAGTDQRELRVAANSSATNEVKHMESGLSLERKCKKLGRSKSSDILKKDGVAFPYDKGKNTLTRFNALKQWGRNRFKLMHRTSDIDTDPGTANDSDFAANSISIEKSRPVDNDATIKQHKNEKQLLKMERPSHKSPTKKAASACNNNEMTGKHLLSVQLRDTTCLNRLRQNVFLNNCNEDQPHSSSGNWSASSESGRTSIGSEITPIHKSSASNTSLNAFNYQAGSGTPFLMYSRRKFLNTSASNSVTSESTLTPELPAGAGESTLSNQLDDETSSAYSCDTEGYYTSFHMDSGLRTLKEEEVPLVTVQPDEQSLNFAHQTLGHIASKNNSELTSLAENDYELFGHGSTSTTTSSAGTVCTTLRVKSSTAEQKNLITNNEGSGRHESPQNNSTNNKILETNKAIESTCYNDAGDARKSSKNETDNSNAANKKKLIYTTSNSNDVEYSGSSDLESTERIERIKHKTAIRSKHIPSMCIITPTTSDDETEQNNNVCNKYHTNDETCSKQNTLQSHKIIKSRNIALSREASEQNHPGLNGEQNQCIDSPSNWRKKDVLQAGVDTDMSHSTQASAHVSFDTQSMNKNAALSRERLITNENESAQSSHSMNSESSKLNVKQLPNNKMNKNNNNLMMTRPMQTSYMYAQTLGKNDIYADCKVTSNGDNCEQRKLLLESHLKGSVQLETLVKDVIEHSPSTNKTSAPPRIFPFKDGSSSNAKSFSRESPMYWTLQNKKSAKKHSSTTFKCRDDIYACRSDDGHWGIENYSNFSRIAHTKHEAFLNSTLKPTDGRDVRLITCELSSDRLNTCADRTGKAKTSLMDFKKLLLAKSVQSSVLPKKMSAVELLKKSPAPAAGDSRGSCNVNTPSPVPQIDKNLKLLRLSGSPKKFANRRMLRQGQFGLPSQSFTSKASISPNGWTNNSRTDIISTTIPEVHAEVDQSPPNTIDNTAKQQSLPIIRSDNCFDKNEKKNFKKNDSGCNSDETLNIRVSYVPSIDYSNNIDVSTPVTTAKSSVAPTLETAL